MSQDGSLATQTNYKAKGEDQACRGNHDMPQLSCPVIAQYYKCHGERNDVSGCPQKKSNVIFCDGPCTKNIVKCEVKFCNEEPKVGHDETTSKEDKRNWRRV